MRRGQKGCAILFWQFETSKLARDSEGKPLLDDKGRPVYETKSLASPRVYRYTVFNAEQCDGLPPRPRRVSARRLRRSPQNVVEGRLRMRGSMRGQRQGCIFTLANRKPNVKRLRKFSRIRRPPRTPPSI